MITTPLVSFVPSTAAQPTDVLRRDNAMREVVAPLKANEPFQRERGLGSDSERRAQSQERSYAQQLAQARLESGFPGFLRRVGGREDSGQSPERDPSTQSDTNPPLNADEASMAQARPDAPTSEQVNLPEAYARAQLQRDDEPLPIRFLDRGPISSGEALEYDWRQYQPSNDLDPAAFERGRRIERFYQASYRPNEQFLLGVA